GGDAAAYPQEHAGHMARMVGLLGVVVREQALGDFLERHREVVLGARLHERRRVVVEGALAELVVVVVDLPGPLGAHDHERIAGIHVLEQIVDAGMDHGRDMVPAGARRPRTSSVSSSTACSRSSFSTTWSKEPASASCLRARAIRSPISPVDSVARSRRRRSSSSTGAETKIVTAAGSSFRTLRAP